MTLNYSHKPVFPALNSENNMCSPMRTMNGLAGSVSERYGDVYPRPCHAHQGEMEDWCFSCWSDDRCYSTESNSKDIVDLLPSDPFGMDIVTGLVWSNGGSTSQGYYDLFASQEYYDLFARWNQIWSNAFSSISQGYDKIDGSLPSVPRIVQFDQKLNDISKVNGCGEAREVEGSLAPYEYQPASNEGVMSLSNESIICSHEVQVEEKVEASAQFGEKVEGAAQFEEAPHEAFKFCLYHLELKDLLSMEGVCTSLRSEVRGDPLLWKNIHVDKPLNKKITEDVLLKLVCRADGNLRSLSLMECTKITDDCIKHILEINPRLMKLFVPGCTKLSIEGILNNIRIHNSKKDVPGIKHLRIGKLYGVTHEQFTELKFLLGADDLGSNQMAHFYHRGNFYLPYDDDRAIDIERCPKCGEFRLVYDCPAKACQVKDKSSQACKACRFCISRCTHCGRCIDDYEYEEDFCMELLCSDCYRPPIQVYGAQHEPSGRDHA